MIGELPQGWAETTIGKIAGDISYGFTAKSTRNTKGPRYLRITDIQNHGVDWDSVPSCNIRAERIPSYQLHSGDLVFARTGATTGKSFLIKSCPEAVFASYLIRVRPAAGLVPEFIAAFFQSSSYWSQISENISGSAQPNCNATKLSSLVLPIPPLSEQRRIVAKLEKLLNQVDTCQHRLAKIPALLKRFRQSVLAAACCGRLTADWREENHQIQTATELLRAFPIERKPPKKRAGRLWGAGEVPQLTDDELESLPSTWAWTKVGELGYDPADAVQVGPMSMQSRDFTEEGVPVLNVGCVQWNGFDESKLDHMPNKKADGFSRYRIASDDILFTRSGTVGRCALATSRQDGWLMTFHLLRVRLNPRKCLPKYLLFVLRGSSNVLRQTTGAAIGSTRAGFNTRLLAQLDVPLPPHGEQQEIIRRVEKLFTLADRLETRFAEAQRRLGSITQAILALAFRGELVPTEFELAKAEGRSFESAEELITRIRTASDARLNGNGSEPRKQKSQRK